MEHHLVNKHPFWDPICILSAVRGLRNGIITGARVRLPYLHQVPARRTETLPHSHVPLRKAIAYSFLYREDGYVGNFIIPLAPSLGGSDISLRQSSKLIPWDVCEDLTGFQDCGARQISPEADVSSRPEPGPLCLHQQEHMLPLPEHAL